MKFLTIALLALLVTACGKNVNERTPNAPTIPRANPGVVTGQPLPTPVGSSGVLNLTFANHAYDQYAVDQFTSFDISTKLKVNFPTLIEETLDFSFDPDDLQDNIVVLVNDDVVCEYRVSSTYDLETVSCVRDLILEVGDDVSVIGIPKGETIRVKMSYQGF